MSTSFGWSIARANGCSAAPCEQLLGRTADDISLSACLDGSAPRVLNIAFPGGSGQWQVRRGSFRQGGLPHTLVVLSDVNVPLRQQERDAWHRLIRVLGHELNNSLAPIKSIAGSLESIAAQDPMPEDWREDMRRGLGIIAGRTDALSRFTTAYTALARLPRPNMREVDLPALVERVARLEMRKTDSGRAWRARRRAGRSRSARAVVDQSRCATPSTRRWRPAGPCVSAGSRTAITWRST